MYFSGFKLLQRGGGGGVVLVDGIEVSFTSGNRDG